jgi:hypothetical protein
VARTAFIQTRDHQPYSPSGAVAARGFELLGWEVRLFERPELDQLSLEPGALVVGGAGTVRVALEKLGVPIPEPPNLPRELEPFWGRRVWATTPAELRTAGSFPVFVKPGVAYKLFEGRVLRRPQDLEALLAPREGFPQVADDTPLEAQDALSFASEWRVFVTRGVVQGISHYAGDPLRFPAANVIRMAVGAWRGAPAGYAVDVGVTDDSRTILVEVNDGYSLGHGGLVADLYARLLLARWDELVLGRR